MLNRFVRLKRIFTPTTAFEILPSVERIKNNSNRLVGVRTKLLFISLILFSCGFLVITSAFATSPQLKISGNQIVTASGGCTVRLRGVDISGLEFSLTGDTGSGAPRTVIPNGTNMPKY